MEEEKLREKCIYYIRNKRRKKFLILFSDISINVFYNRSTFFKFSINKYSLLNILSRCRYNRFYIHVSTYL